MPRVIVLSLILGLPTTTAAQDSVLVMGIRGEALPGCSIEITLETSGGILLERMDKTLDLPADSAEVVARFSWTLPANARWVRCRLRQGDEELSCNEYDLSFCDAKQPGRWQRLRSRMGDRLMGGN